MTGLDIAVMTVILLLALLLFGEDNSSRGGGAQVCEVPEEDPREENE